MLNKLIKVILLFVLVLGIGSYNADSADAATKVMWGKTELKLGQIGKVTILNDTPLVAMDKEGRLHTIRKLKKGDEFRVYQYKGQHNGLYGVGNSSFVQKDDTKVLYETPSKKKLELVNEQDKAPVIEDVSNAEKIFNDTLDSSYKIDTFDSTVDAYLNDKRIFTYDKTDKNYFFINDTTKVSEAYKLMKALGFKLNEAELKALIKKASGGKAISEGSLYVSVNSVKIQIRW